MITHYKTNTVNKQNLYTHEPGKVEILKVTWKINENAHVDSIVNYDEINRLYKN